MGLSDIGHAHFKYVIPHACENSQDKAAYNIYEAQPLPTYDALAADTLRHTLRDLDVWTFDLERLPGR